MTLLNCISIRWISLTFGSGTWIHTSFLRAMQNLQYNVKLCMFYFKGMECFSQSSSHAFISWRLRDHYSIEGITALYCLLQHSPEGKVLHAVHVVRELNDHRNAQQLLTPWKEQNTCSRHQESVHRPRQPTIIFEYIAMHNTLSFLSTTLSYLLAIRYRDERNRICRTKNWLISIGKKIYYKQ